MFIKIYWILMISSGKHVILTVTSAQVEITFTENARRNGACSCAFITFRVSFSCRLFTRLVLKDANFGRYYAYVVQIVVLGNPGRIGGRIK